MFYFAYGVNMNHRGMAQRCPDSKFISAASLQDHELLFDGQSLIRPGGTANITVNLGHQVWGGLFEISEADLAALDAFERYPDSYQRKKVSVMDTEGNIYEAVVYYRTNQEPAVPGESYLSEVLAGARDCMLPEDYISKLSRMYK